jgi:hypothetical protein
MMAIRMLFYFVANFYSIILFNSLNKLQSFEMPCEMTTASFHPTAREFVCGGLDFRIYKYNFETGVELGK